jgi:hypothetical protein
LICHKTSGNDYRIPFELPFSIPTDTTRDVSPLLFIDATLVKSKELDHIVTVEDAIQLYLTTFPKQFSGKDTLKKKCRILNRLLEHLRQRGHAQLVSDITREDGQSLLDSLQNSYTSGGLKQGTRHRYGSILRTFSRFLFDTGLHPDDVFRSVR